MAGHRTHNIHQHLIDGCKRGDSKSQFEIYKLYHRAMYNTSLRLVSDPVEAEDIMQESFFKAFDRIGTYRNEASFGAWLKRIVVNASLDFLKKKRPIMFQIETAHHVSNDDDRAEDFEPETVEQLKRAIEELPERSKLVLNLVYLEGYSHNEVAQMLGIGSSTSRSQLARAKQALINVLKEKPKEHG